MLFKLEPRGEHSRKMAYLSPLLAGVLTLLTSGIFFYLQGHDPFHALKTILYTPISIPTVLPNGV